MKTLKTAIGIGLALSLGFKSYGQDSDRPEDWREKARLQNIDSIAVGHDSLVNVLDMASEKLFYAHSPEDYKTVDSLVTKWHQMMKKHLDMMRRRGYKGY